jgi:hypothetical protein
MRVGLITRYSVIMEQESKEMYISLCKNKIK